MTTTDNANSVFSCDEHDSLDYNGYKLYRLVLENPPEHLLSVSLMILMRTEILWLVVM